MLEKNMDVILSDRLASLKTSKPNARVIKIESVSCVTIKRINLKENYREGKKLGQLRVSG